MAGLRMPNPKKAFLGSSISAGAQTLFEMVFG